MVLQGLTINGIDGFGKWGTEDLRTLGEIPEAFPITTLSGTRTFLHGLENYDINARYRMTYDVVPDGSVEHNINLFGTDIFCYVKVVPETLAYVIDGAGGGIKITSSQPYNVEIEFYLPNEEKNNTVEKKVEFKISNGRGYAVKNLRIQALESKWTFHNNVHIVNNEMIELNMVGTGSQASFVQVDVLKNTEYVFHVNHNGRIAVQKPSDLSFISPYTTSSLLTFNSGDNSVVNLVLTNLLDTAGKYYFNYPMFNLGLAISPYEKKRGDKMVLPTPKKNLMPTLNEAKYNEVGSGTSNTISSGRLASLNYDAATLGKGVAVDVIPYQQYTFSILIEPNLENKKGSFFAGHTAGGSELIYHLNLSGFITETFTPTQSKVYFKFTGSNTTALLSPVYFSNIQLEEGASATTYEPYFTYLNPKPKQDVIELQTANATYVNLGTLIT